MSSVNRADSLRAYQIEDILQRNRYVSSQLTPLGALGVTAGAGFCGFTTGNIAACGYNIYTSAMSYFANRNVCELDRATLNGLTFAGMMVGFWGTMSCYALFNGPYQKHYEILNLQILKNYKPYQYISDKDLETIKANGNQNVIREINNRLKEIPNKKNIPHITSTERTDQEKRILTNLYHTITWGTNTEKSLSKCKKVFGERYFIPVVSTFLKTKISPNQLDILRKIYLFAKEHDLKTVVKACENCALGIINRQALRQFFT